MSLVYSFSVQSKYSDETDICVLFSKGAPMKMRTGSGNFRVFIKKLESCGKEYMFTGKVGVTDVQGSYNPIRKEGFVIFFKESRVVRSVGERKA